MSDAVSAAMNDGSCVDDSIGCTVDYISSDNGVQ